MMLTRLDGSCSRRDRSRTRKHELAYFLLWLSTALAGYYPEPEHATSTVVPTVLHLLVLDCIC